MGLSHCRVQGRSGVIERVWSATCDQVCLFTSVASIHPGIAFTRIGGVSTVHIRGPESQAETVWCPADAEFFGLDLRLGAYLPPFPAGVVANLQDAELPVLDDGRIWLDGRAWEMPTAHNVDVFAARLVHAGLLTFDPLVEELRHGPVHGMPARTAQSRFTRAVGMSRRATGAVEQAREAGRMLRGGMAIADVVHQAGYYDQPHLTRATRRYIDRTPAELAVCADFLDL